MKRSVLVVLALCIVAAASAPLWASEPILIQGTAVRSNVSEPIRDLIPDMKVPATGLAMEIPIGARPGQIERTPADGGPDTSLQTGPGATLTPAVDLTFEGLSDDDNADIVGIRIVPPDTEGDIGFDEEGNRIYIQWINLIVAVYDADTGAMTDGPFAGNIFWAGFTGSTCATENDGDPVVLYDDDAGRWAMSQFDVGNGLMCWAVSQTSDPLGVYNQYEFQIASAAGGNPDYPKAGVWAQDTTVGVGANESAYTQTTRNFPFTSSSFMQLVTYERDEMLAGNPSPQFRQFGFPCVTGNCLEGALPPHQAGVPPAQGTCPSFFAIVDAQFDDTPTGATDGVRIFELCSNWGGTATLNETFAASSANFSRALGNGFSDCITPVPAGGEALDCLAIFTMFRAQYRWFQDGASVVLNTTVDAGSERGGIHWMELQSADGQTGWTISQEGTYAPDDGADRWMGSIAQDGSRNIALGFSITRSGGAGDILPSVHYTARQFGDPAGTMGDEEICHTGTGVQTGSANRWGDYSSMSVDPDDDCTFWYTQEYYETTGSFDFTTRICSFAFQDCTGKGCVLDASAPRNIRRGESLPVDLSITHNRPATVEVPFSLQVRDRRGRVIASDQTQAFTLHFGQTVQAAHTMALPSNLRPGVYRLTVRMPEMRGGTEVTNLKFRVR